MAPSPLQTQIPPLRIDGNDQCDLLTPQPPLDPLLELNRISNIFKPLEVDEAVNLVLRGKAGPSARLVLSHPLNQVPRHARVECFRSIRHDVNKVRFRRTRLHRSFASLRMTKPAVRSM